MIEESSNITKLKKLINYEDYDQCTHELELACDIINDANDNGYWSWNIEKEFCYLSSSVKKLLGYSDDELNGYKPLTELLVKGDDIKFINKLDEYIKSKTEKPFQIILDYYHKDGSVVTLLCRGLITDWGINNEPKKMVGSYINITKL